MNFQSVCGGIQIGQLLFVKNIISFSLEARIMSFIVNFRLYRGLKNLGNLVEILAKYLIHSKNLTKENRLCKKKKISHLFLIHSKIMSGNKSSIVFLNIYPCFFKNPLQCFFKYFF